MADENLVSAVFRHHVVPNEAASKAAGRPIFDDMEVCDLRFPGDRQRVLTVPAHEVEPNATRESVANGGEPITYAMLYNKQYLAFKNMETQDQSGTPLSELPFLTEGKRRELKALNIHTAEQLASVDGTPLKQLGMGGRELKMQATAYLETASGTSIVTEQASRIAALEQMLADQRELLDGYMNKGAKTKLQRRAEQMAAERAEEEAEQDEQPEPPEDDTNTDQSEGEPDDDTKALEDCTDAELKAYIKQQTGEAPKGNPSRETLIARAMELAKAQD